MLNVIERIKIQTVVAKSWTLEFRKEIQHKISLEL